MSAGHHEPVAPLETVAFEDDEETTIAPVRVPDEDGRRSLWITSDNAVRLEAMR